MLPKRSRIPRSSFKKILDSRRYLNSEHFTLRIAPSDTFKMAVSVSKKVSKSAVDRNRVRRRAYSALKSIIPSLKPNLYLLVAKPGILNLKGVGLERELADLFQKV